MPKRKKSAKSRQDGNVLLPFILLLIVLAVAFYLLSSGIIPNPFRQEPKVTLRDRYNNPFDKEAQYVNPFSEYQNPFDQLE